MMTLPLIKIRNNQDQVPLDEDVELLQLLELARSVD